MEYKLNKPYPKVRVKEKNLSYASLLLQDYAGALSEDTAIHLYLYQSLVAPNDKTEYQEAMLKIAEVEMTHLRLLGEAIKKLGAVPIYGSVSSDQVMRLWNAANVNYSRPLKEMLKIDMEAETAAINMYQGQLQQIKDPYIQELIKRIIEDEQLHLSIFRMFYQKYFGQIEPHL